MDMSKILVVVKFGGALIFFFFFFVGLWLFGCMGIFWTCDFGHGIFFFFFFFVCYGKFLIMWFWSWKIFWTCDLRHGNFGHVILVMGIFWAYDFGHENFWSCGNFKWDKFRIHLMRSYSTNLNLSWLALMEFALMRQSWMPLVWKWMHDFFWNNEILVFYEKMMTVVPFFFFFLKVNEAWPNAPSLQMDAWLFENLDIWGKDDFFFSKWMKHGRMPLV